MSVKNGFMEFVEGTQGRFKIWHPTPNSRWVLLDGSQEIIIGSYPEHKLAVASAHLKVDNDE